MNKNFLKGITRPLQVAFVAFSMLACTGAQALPYLVGAGLYDANSDGSARLLGFRYTTNSNDTSAALPLDLTGDTPDAGAVGKTISFELGLGTNVVTFERSRSAGYTPSYYGLQLFFNGSGTSFNPSQISPAIIGDLVASVQANSSSFLIPGAGTLVPNYGNNGTSSSTVTTAPYNGATSFSVGLYDIAVTGFDIAHDRGGANTMSGSFTLEVTQRTPTPSVPEPYVPALLGVGFAALGFGRKLARR